MKNTNSGYKREKELFQRLEMKPVPFSGSRWESGREDGYDGHRLGQVKSTGSQILSVRYRYLYELQRHCNASQRPLFLLDFVSPKIGEKELPPETWIAMPLGDFQQLWEVYRREVEREENLALRKLFKSR